MVDIFFKLIETIIELLKLKQHNREQAFKEIVEPLFNEMPLVVQDYFLLFQEAEEYAQSGTSKAKLRKAIDKIKKRREEFLHARIKIREMADLIRHEFDDKQIIDFSENILKFFYSSQIVPTLLFRSNSLRLVELFELLENNELSERELYYNIRSTRSHLEDSWSAITKAYALLRINYLKPQGVKKRRSKRSIDKNS